MEKKNTGLIVLIVILCLLVGGLTGYIIGNKIFDKTTDNKNNGIVENNDDNKSNIVNYSFGDEVIISKMSMVKNFVPGEDSIDLSKWHVLSDKDNIVTLYSDAIWGKDYKIDDKKELFKEYGVTIENMRGLDAPARWSGRPAVRPAAPAPAGPAGPAGPWWPRPQTAECSLYIPVACQDLLVTDDNGHAGTTGGTLLRFYLNVHAYVPRS